MWQVPSRYLCLASWPPFRLQPLLLLWSVASLLRVGGLCKGSGKSHTYSERVLAPLPLGVRWALGENKDIRNSRIVICLLYESESSDHFWDPVISVKVKAVYAHHQLIHQRLFLERRNDYSISKVYFLSLILKGSNSLNLISHSALVIRSQACNLNEVFPLWC